MSVWLPVAMSSLNSLHYLPLRGCCDFCLEKSFMEIWDCLCHGADFTCKDPVLAGSPAASNEEF